MIEKIQTKHILWAGCLLTLLYAIFSNGFYHSDEHYQILEYAHMKLFGTPTPDNLPWEYPMMMRSGLQPLIAYGVGWVLDACNLYDPQTFVLLLRLLSGTLSVVVMLFFFRTVKGQLGGVSWEKWYLILGFFLWFMAYLHVRFSAEMLSGNLLLLLAALCMQGEQAPRRSHWTQGLLLGVVAGGLFITRFQMGFALAGFGLWLLVFDRKWAKLGGLALGVAVMLGVGVLIDRWLYGC